MSSGQSIGIGAHRPAAFYFVLRIVEVTTVLDRWTLQVILTLYHHSVGSILSTRTYRFSLSNDIDCDGIVVNSSDLLSKSTDSPGDMNSMLNFDTQAQQKAINCHN